MHSRNWGALEAVIAGRWARSCSVIHSEHGSEVEASAEPQRRSWFRRVAFELAHRVFSVSYQLRNTLSKRTGFPQRKIQVIHNGVDLRKFRRDESVRQRFRHELGIAEEDFCIGCVGRLNRIKDYPTALRGMEVLSESCSSWRLLIAGDGPERQALEKSSPASPALQGRVSFLGTTQCVPEFLNALDVYVLPSIVEGVSNSLLEAMAASLPAIGFRYRGQSRSHRKWRIGTSFSSGRRSPVSRLPVTSLPAAGPSCPIGGTGATEGQQRVFPGFHGRATMRGCTGAWREAWPYEARGSPSQC